MLGLFKMAKFKFNSSLRLSFFHEEILSKLRNKSNLFLVIPSNVERKNIIIEAIKSITKVEHNDFMTNEIDSFLDPENQFSILKEQARLISKHTTKGILIIVPSFETILQMYRNIFFIQSQHPLRISRIPSIFHPKASLCAITVSINRKQKVKQNFD